MIGHLISKWTIADTSKFSSPTWTKPNCAKCRTLLTIRLFDKMAASYQILGDGKKMAAPAQARQIEEDPCVTGFHPLLVLTLMVSNKPVTQ